jgi:hypothetical protein
MKPSRCTNLNHGRNDPPVRVCPMCGEVVNAARPAPFCQEVAHGARRKNGDRFCIDCGLRLREQ